MGASGHVTSQSSLDPFLLCTKHCPESSQHIRTQACLVLMRFVLLRFTDVMGVFLQIGGTTVQKDCDLLYCSSLEPNP